MTDQKSLTDEELRMAIEVWKEVVGVQKHFNDIEMKIRGLALTAAAAIFTAIGFAIKEDVNLSHDDIKVPLGAALCFVGFVIALAFWFMDRHWYHKLLYGAVKQGQILEKQISAAGIDAGLTESIGKESPVKIGQISIHSKEKIDIFYFLFFLLTLSAGFSFIDLVLGTVTFFILLGGMVVHVFNAQIK